MKAYRVKNSAFVFTVLAVILLCVPSAYAKAKKSEKPAPVNIRIVQKESADGVKIFSAIQEAVNSITDASASNRYVIKITPGAYNEAVTMKEYVDIEGAGQGNTIIASSAPVTITSANNTKIKNMKIINTAPDAEGSEGTAVLFNGVTAEADSLSVEAQGNAPRAVIRIAESSNVRLNNVNVRSENLAPDKENKGVAVISGRADISNLRAVVSGGSWAAAVVVRPGGEMDLRNSVLEASNAAYTDAVDVHSDNKVSIKGSKMIAFQGSGDTLGLSSNNNKNTIVANSEIRARSDAGSVIGVRGGKVRDSIIEGGVSGSNLTNCKDEKNKPIPVSIPKKAPKK